MTISTTSPRQTFLTDGVTTVFPVPIQAYNATDFLVLLTPAGGGPATILTLNSNYTLAPNSSDTPPKWALTSQTGGGVTSPFAAGQTLQVILNPVQNQPAQFVQGQAFPSLAVQTQFDREAQMVQRLQDVVSRAICAPDGDNAPSMLLPAASARALLVPQFDANGNLIVAATLPPATTLSAAVIGGFLYPIVAGEVGVANLQYPYGWLQRYGTVDITGVIACDTAMANALASWPTVYLPPGPSLLLLASNAGYNVFAKRIQGPGQNQCEIRYTGTGVCFTVGGTDTAAPGLSGFRLNGLSLGTQAGGILFSQAGVGVRNGQFFDLLVTGFTKANTFAIDMNGFLGAGVYYNELHSVGAGSTILQALTFTAGLLANATSGTLSANFTLASGVYACQFSDGESRLVTLTNGATSATWSTGLVNGVTSALNVTNGNANGFRLYSSDGAANGNRCNANTLVMCRAQFNAGDGFFLDYCTGNALIGCDREQNGGYGINTNHVLDVTVSAGYSENNFLGWVRKTASGSVRAFGGQVVDSGVSSIVLASGDVFMVRPASQPVFGDTGGVGFNGATPPAVGLNWAGGADALIQLGGATVLSIDSTNFLTRMFRGYTVVPDAISTAGATLDFSASQKSACEVTLNNNITAINMPPFADGRVYKIHFKQGAGGPYTVAGWPASVHFAGSAFNPTATLGKFDSVSIAGSQTFGSLWLEEGRSQNM